MKTKSEEYAFPKDNLNQIQGGLTKREYFAAMAMQGILAGTSGVEALASVHPSSWAEVATQAADSLIQALNTKADHDE